MFKRKYPRIGWYVSFLGQDENGDYEIADHLHHNVITVDEEAYLIAQRLDELTNPKDIKDFSAAKIKGAIDMFDDAGIIEYPHKILGIPCYFISPNQSKQQKAIWMAGKLFSEAFLPFGLIFSFLMIYSYFKHYTSIFLFSLAFFLFQYVGLLVIEEESKYAEFETDYKRTHQIDDFDF